MQDSLAVQLQSRKESLIQQLQQVNIDCHHQYHQLSQLGDPHLQDLEEDINQVEKNLKEAKENLKEMSYNCSKAVKQRKDKIKSIQDYESKNSKMHLIFEEQQKKLSDVQSSSNDVEQAIKECRDYYQQLQQENHSLDEKAQNLKNYGYQDVPESVFRLLQEKKTLQQQNCLLDEKIGLQKKQLSQMVSRQEVQNLQKRKEQLTQRNNELEELRKQNEDLMKENQSLNLIKSQYEWNPNMQIKVLENSLCEQEQKISLLEKDILAIHKKSTECSQKIDQYNTYLQNSDICRNDKGKVKTKSKMTIYDEIRQQLRMQSFQGSQKQSKKSKQMDKKSGNIRRTSIFQLCLSIIVLIGLTIWCHKTYKR